MLWLICEIAVNIHTGNITWTKHVVSIYLGICTSNSNEKEVASLTESKEGIGFGGRKRKENDIISKNSIDNKNKEKRKKANKIIQTKNKTKGDKEFPNY